MAYINPVVMTGKIDPSSEVPWRENRLTVDPVVTVLRGG
jgi:hypothetical protein